MNAGPAPTYAYELGEALYLNVTSACTLACVFCPKIRDDNWVVGGFDLKLARPPTADEVWAQVTRHGLAGRPEVVFTGLGEPTRSLAVLLDVTRRLKAAGVGRVRLDTDGLANLREGRDVTAELAEAGLDAVVVSLNAPDAGTYVRLCPNRHGEAAWHAARAFLRAAIPRLASVEASFVAVPGLSEDACRREAEGLGARFRWRPYDRVGRLRELGGNA
ncbi:MAG TPA: TatD family nuclease-associated radical SAM protein [Anaeromyxobacteraceae bacterium]|nr:TatD family nuclease-associated radical SAM protein [Anaeromyxobacteraceae bacterium]